MATISDILAAYNEFPGLLRQCAAVSCDENDVAELCSLAALRAQPWARQAGAYALLYGSHVRYVGRALKGQGLALRVWEHIRGDKRFTINTESAEPPRLVVLALEDDDAWLAPSLQLLLHWRTRGDGDLFNKKRC